MRSEGVGSIDEPDSSAWLSMWGSVCVGLVFRRCLRQNVLNSTLGNTMSYIIIHENCRGKGTGMVGVQSVVYLRCAANQRNVVRQSNYALKAINGGGNDIIA